MTRSTITCLLCLALIGTAVAEPPVLHDWRSTSGAATKAAFFSFDQEKGAVVLLFPRTLQVSLLAPESVELAKRLAAAEAQAQGDGDGDLRAELEQTRQQLAEMTDKFQQALRGKLSEAKQGLRHLQDGLESTNEYIDLLKRSVHAAEMRYALMSPADQEAAMAAMKQAKAKGPRTLNKTQVALLYRVGSPEAVVFADEATGKTYDDARVPD